MLISPCPLSPVVLRKSVSLLALLSTFSRKGEPCHPVGLLSLPCPVRTGTGCWSSRPCQWLEAWPSLRSASSTHVLSAPSCHKGCRRSCQDWPSQVGSCLSWMATVTLICQRSSPQPLQTWAELALVLSGLEGSPTLTLSIVLRTNPRLRGSPECIP